MENSGISSALIARNSGGSLISGSSMKIYRKNPKQLEVAKKEFKGTTPRKTLYGQIQTEIELLNDKIALMKQYVNSYNKYQDLVKDFYELFEIYNATEINNEKEAQYGKYNPIIFRWYEDQHIWYDANTGTLHIQ